MTEYERRVEANAAFDKRDPNPAKNNGIHGVEFRFSLIGPDAAVSVGISTGWLLPKTVGIDDVPDSFLKYAEALRGMPGSHLHPMPTGMYFHVASPIRDYMRDNDPNECDLLSSGRCWSGVTYTGADRPMYALLGGGLDGLFECLEGELSSFIGGGE